MALCTDDLLEATKKATKPKMEPAKLKHIQRLRDGTSLKSVDLAQVTRFLSKKLQDGNSATSYKAILIIHDLLRMGSARFMNYVSTAEHLLRVESRTDDYAEYIKMHTEYLCTRVRIFKTLKYDILRTSAAEQSAQCRYPKKSTGAISSEEELLFKKMEVLQQLVDVHFTFNYTEEDLTNVLVMEGFKLLLLDLMKTYAYMNEGMVSILDAFFELSVPAARRALELYIVFVAQSSNIADRFKLAKKCVVGIKVPTSRIPPASLIDVLHEYLETQENRGETNPSNNLAVHSNERETIPTEEAHPFKINHLNGGNAWNNPPAENYGAHDPFINPYDERDRALFFSTTNSYESPANSHDAMVLSGSATNGNNPSEFVGHNQANNSQQSMGRVQFPTRVSELPHPNPKTVAPNQFEFPLIDPLRNSATNIHGGLVSTERRWPKKETNPFDMANMQQANVTTSALGMKKNNNNPFS